MLITINILTRASNSKKKNKYALNIIRALILIAFILYISPFTVKGTSQCYAEVIM